MLEPVPEDGSARVSGAGASPPRLLMAAHRNNSKRQNGFNDSSSTLDVDTARTNESAEGGGDANSADHTATVTPRADGPSGNVAAKIVVYHLLCTACCAVAFSSGCGYNGAMCRCARAP
jgi:hypothetical protein